MKFYYYNNSDYETALHIAVYRHHIDVIKILLDDEAINMNLINKIYIFS